MEIIKFYPIHKPTIWGSETWIASAVKGVESIVSEGCYKGMSLTEIVERFGSAFLGEANSARFGKDFPLLIKMIDAQRTFPSRYIPTTSFLRKDMARWARTRCGTSWMLTTDASSLPASNIIWTRMTMPRKFQTAASKRIWAKWMWLPETASIFRPDAYTALAPA